MSHKLSKSKQGRSVTPAYMRKKKEQSYELTELDRKLPYVQAVLIVLMIVLVVLFVLKVIGELVAVWIMAAAYFAMAAYRNRRDSKKKILNQILMALYVGFAVMNIIALLQSLT